MVAAAASPAGSGSPTEVRVRLDFVGDANDARVRMTFPFSKASSSASPQSANKAGKTAGKTAGKAGKAGGGGEELGGSPSLGTRPASRSQYSSGPLDGTLPSAAERAMDIARKRLSTRSAEEAGSELQDEMKGIFVSEWLTQHPLLLAGKFPSHIWLHADCPTPEPQGETDDAAARVAKAKLSYAIERLTELNLRGIAHAQRGELDEALLAWRSMEEDLKASVPKGEQPALLAVAYNNLAGVYYARSKSSPAAQYVERAARLEQRVYGAPDFGTRLRLGAVYSRAKRHTEALSQCSLALDVLRSTEELRLDHSSTLDEAAAAAFTHGVSTHGGGSSTTAAGSRAAGEGAATAGEAAGAAGEGAAVGPHEANYQAHLAVAYHNLAVELASTQQFGPASAMVDVARHLIEQVSDHHVL